MRMSIISRLLYMFVVLLVAAIVRAKVPGQVENIFGQCIVPLGMEAGKIPDDAITASSSYEMKSVGPQNARIRQEKNGGAWCPKAQISSAIKEYLEIDLTKNHLITWTETQGRFGNGQGQEYAEAFFLEYWRDEKWHQYKNLDGDRVLRGNSNTYLVEKQKLDLPFVASRVRFVPYSLHPRTVCMRVEIYGCIWAQYILRYIAPKGSMNYEDTSYDGVEIERVLEGGLGQLTDGILGDVSEILNPSTRTNWVGWSDREDVQLIFEFQDFQLFQNCSIHLANLPEQQIEIFSVLRVWFSLDGIVYQPEPETLESPRDSQRNAITVSIALQSRVARFIKLELVLYSRRLVISEVMFQTGIESLSEEDSINRRVENSMENSVGVNTAGNEGREWPERAVRAYGNESELRLESELPESTLKIPNGTIYRRGTNGANSDRSEISSANAIPVGTSQSYIGLVSGVLTVVILTLSCTTFLMKQRGRNKVALLQKHTALLCGHSATESGNTINLKDGKLRNSVLINGLTHSRLSLKSKPAQFDRSPTPRASAPAILTLETSSDCSSRIYDSTYKPFSENNVITIPSVSANEAEYAEFKSTLNFPKKNIMGALTSTSFLPKERSQTQTIKPNSKIHESHYAATDILTIKKREQPSTSNGSLFTPMQIRDEALLSCNLKSYEIQRISRYRLRILNKVGEGSFGLVHVCEAKAILSVETGTVKNRQLVIVKSLWRGAVDSLRKDFTRDMCVLAAIRDPNIARIIALVEEEPLGAVFEYGQYGDLPTFLHDHENKIDNNLSPASPRFRRLNFLTQIASGMKYLESLNIPHCDLAARNCMVTQDLMIKVSDHAVYCTQYDHHYYMDGSYAKIPLRWMAWEAVLLVKSSKNQRTCRGDVWSYAVTTWEILKNCKEIPFSELTSEQVLENCGRWYHGNTQSDRNQPHLLVRPACCPEKLYQIMVNCWCQQSEDRPTFEEIYRYLDMLDFD